MEFKFKGVKVNLPEGVDAAKFDADRVIANIPEEVLKLFEGYGIHLKEECPGVFLKAFNLTKIEFEEVKENLKRLEELGLIGLFQMNSANLQVRYFKNTFMKRLVECMKNGRPYLNPDNTFASFLVKNEMEEKQEEMSSNVINVNFGNGKIDNNPQEETNDMMEENFSVLSEDDRTRYRQFLYDMNIIMGQNPMDERLVGFIKTAINMVGEAITRGEYKYVNMDEILASIKESLYEQLDANDYIKDLVSGAFGEERKVA